MTEATNIVRWVGTDGAEYSILYIEPDKLPENDVQERMFEIAKRDSEDGEWKHHDTIAYIDEIQSFGIPEDFDG